MQEFKRQSGLQSVQWDYSNLSQQVCLMLLHEKDAEDTSNKDFIDWTHFMDDHFIPCIRAKTDIGVF